MDQNQVIASVVRQVLESMPEQAEVQQDKMTLALARALIARVEKKAAEMGVNLSLIHIFFRINCHCAAEDVAF